MMDHPIPPGRYFIEFVGDTQPMGANIVNQAITGDAHILYLVGEDGAIYNWSTIIKLTKVKE